MKKMKQWKNEKMKNEKMKKWKNEKMKKWKNDKSWKVKVAGIIAWRQNDVQLTSDPPGREM